MCEQLGHGDKLALWREACNSFVFLSLGVTVLLAFASRRKRRSTPIKKTQHLQVSSTWRWDHIPLMKVV